MQLLEKSKIDKILLSAVERQRIVGASIVVAHRGEIIYKEQAGWADRAEQKPVTEQTLFRLASMTKPIVTAAALALVEKGILKLDAPVTCWLPTFNPKLPDGKSTQITLYHLLTHTAGLSYSFLSKDNEPYKTAGISDGLDEQGLSLAENVERLGTVPLLFVPGTAWCYSLATDVLGAVLEQACQQSLPDIIEKYITGPLRMQDTTFYVSEKNRLTKAYVDNNDLGKAARAMHAKDELVLKECGVIHYAPDRATHLNAYPSGGAGMVGTASDYLRFLETIRQGGDPILQPPSINLLTQDRVKGLEVFLPGPGFGHGMSFSVVRDSKVAGTRRYVNSYGWGGVYGTTMFVDPVLELSVVILTNTTLHGLIGTFPMDITSAIYDVLDS